MDTQCPLWSTAAFSKQEHSGKTVASHRAGGLYRLDESTKLKLAHLPPEAKGGLSYRIYQHNRRYRLFERLQWLMSPSRYGDEPTDFRLTQQPVKIDAQQLERVLAQQPTTEERIRGYMQELVRQQALAGSNLIVLHMNGGNMDLLQAASGCREAYGQAELEAFHTYAEQKEWIWRNPSGDIRVHLSGHMYVEHAPRIPKPAGICRHVV